MTLLHHKVPFEEPPSSDGERTWLWDQRRDLLGLVEEQRKELARLERENRELRHRLEHRPVPEKRKRWWR